MPIHFRLETLPRAVCQCWCWTDALNSLLLAGLHLMKNRSVGGEASRQAWEDHEGLKSTLTHVLLHEEEVKVSWSVPCLAQRQDEGLTPQGLGPQASARLTCGPRESLAKVPGLSNTKCSWWRGAGSSEQVAFPAVRNRAQRWEERLGLVFVPSFEAGLTGVRQCDHTRRGCSSGPSCGAATTKKFRTSYPLDMCKAFSLK